MGLMAVPSHCGRSPNADICVDAADGFEYLVTRTGLNNSDDDACACFGNPIINDVLYICVLRISFRGREGAILLSHSAIVVEKAIAAFHS